MNAEHISNTNLQYFKQLRHLRNLEKLGKKNNSKPQIIIVTPLTVTIILSSALYF